MSEWSIPQDMPVKWKLAGTDSPVYTVPPAPRKMTTMEYMVPASNEMLETMQIQRIISDVVSRMDRHLKYEAQIAEGGEPFPSDETQVPGSHPDQEMLW